jgi:hypothetical protein
MGLGRCAQGKTAVSIKLISVVWSLEIRPTDKLVLLALADNANDEGGRCYPSMRTLQQKTSLSNRAVRYSIKRLEKNGHLMTQNRNGHSLNFTLTPRHQMPMSPAAVAYLPRQHMPVTPATDAKTPAPDADITITTVIEPSRERRATALSDDFGLTPKREEEAKARGLDPNATMEEFRDYYLAKGSRWVDWDAVWRKWCRKEKDFKARIKPKPPDHSAEWAEAKSRAKAIGFRAPGAQESVGAYMTDIKLAENAPRTGLRSIGALADKMKEPFAQSTARDIR